MQVIGYENNNRVVAKHRIADNHNDFKLCQGLEPLLNALLIERPAWTFRVEQPYTNNSAVEFAIIQDDEELGVVRWAWAAGEYKYYVSNDRINDARQRGRGYTTKDMRKAVLKIKKMFSAQTVTEKLEKAEDEAQAKLNATFQRKHREYYNSKSAVDKQALAYVQEIGWEEFVNYIRENDPTTMNTILKCAELKSERAYMESVNNAFHRGEALLVVQEGSRYIVKSKDGMKIHNDDDLPDHMRPKLGMLKLVEKETYITNSGFRAGDTMFVVTAEEKKDEQV